jgi:hypothetical protein
MSLIFRHLLRLRRISFYLGGASRLCRSTPYVSDFPQHQRNDLAQVSPEDWLLALGAALLALVLLGILPHMFW